MDEFRLITPAADIETLLYFIVLPINYNSGKIMLVVVEG